MSESADTKREYDKIVAIMRSRGVDVTTCEFVGRYVSSRYTPITHTEEVQPEPFTPLQDATPTRDVAVNDQSEVITIRTVVGIFQIFPNDKQEVDVTCNNEYAISVKTPEEGEAFVRRYVERVATTLQHWAKSDAVK